MRLKQSKLLLIVQFPIWTRQMLHLLFKSEALYLVGLDLCYEKLILIFHVEKIALFEFQKRGVFHPQKGVIFDLKKGPFWSHFGG